MLLRGRLAVPPACVQTVKPFFIEEEIRSKSSYIVWSFETDGCGGGTMCMLSGCVWVCVRR